MRIHRSDNPLADFMAREAEQESWLAERPVCADCDEPIQDDHCFEINGEYICPRCMEDLHRRDVDDLCL